MRFKRKNRMQETVELNITAFLNLMVILVPFLLITAVFSRITVLELNLPALNAQEAEQEEVNLQLQLVVRPDVIDIQDASIGLIKRIDRAKTAESWRPLVDVLVEVKSRFPEEKDITLLLDSTVSYRTMIEIMDHVGSADVVIAGTLENVELFPNISIGDAPVSAAEAAQSEPAEEAN